MNTTTQYSTPSPSAGLTPKERLLQKLEESIVNITNEDSLSNSAYAGLIDIIGVVRHLVEENETLKADIQALQNARKGAGWG